MVDIEIVYNQWSSILIGVGALAGTAGTVVYFWTKTAQAQRKEVDTTNSKIKDLWQERLELQDQRMKDLENRIKIQREETERIRKRQHQLEKDNQLYVSIFQGRDEDAVKFRKDSREKFDVLLESIQKIYELLAQRCLDNGGDLNLIESKIKPSE